MTPPSPQTPPCLQLSNISVEVQTKHIITNFSLTIKPGETHVLMGPNGSGKSTLAATLAGNVHHHITSGTIHYNGEDITNISAEERARKGIFLAFQHPLEIPGVQFNQYLYQITKKRFPTMSVSAFQEQLAQLLPALGLDNTFLQRDLNVGFSGGEKKRAEVLQLLLLKPQLVILDETDSGLDVDSLKLVGNALHTLKQQHTSILIITHYPRILAYLPPDYVHIFKEGTLYKTGPYALAKEIEEHGYP